MLNSVLLLIHVTFILKACTDNSLNKVQGDKRMLLVLFEIFFFLISLFSLEVLLHSNVGNMYAVMDSISFQLKIKK